LLYLILAKLVIHWKPRTPGAQNNSAGFIPGGTDLNYSVLTSILRAAYRAFLQTWDQSLVMALPQDVHEPEISLATETAEIVAPLGI
jgi:hypothetical protein